MIITKTPLRISLVGGGTDMPSFYTKHTGAVVSFAIDKYVYVCVNKKFDKKIRVSYSKTENVGVVDEIEHELVRECLRFFKVHEGVEVVTISDIPGMGSGLGSSSSLTVGLINALGHGSPKSMLAERAFTIEAEKCYHSIGKQDHYAAAWGGMNYMRFFRNSVEVKTMFPVAEMLDHMLLLWTGISRHSEEILVEQRSRYNSGETLKVGVKLAKLARDFHDEYLMGMRPNRIGEYLHENWELKKRLSNITNCFIDDHYETAMKNGAYGGKLLGAGQGGFLLFVAPPEKHADISVETGLRIVNFKISHTGSEVVYHD